MTDETNKQYIGDDVYVSYDGYNIVLCAESGGQDSVIYLEPEVLAALAEYAERVKSEAGKSE